MKFGYFTLFVALVISAVAEFYSIVGLTSIFAAAFWPVVIMGAALGVGKVTAAVWLKLNWDRAKWTYKIYLVPAVIFLMFLTSMGIFGYLSKAHSDQSLVSGDVLAKIAVYDEKIKIAKENIDANRRALKQLDEAVDQVMGRSTTETGADKAVAIRRGQAKERSRLLQEIASEQKTIAKLNEERAPIAAEVRKVEAEVGPIKYIAAMIYGDNPDANLLEAAVRWVIILIVAVFDPLALMLILAAQQSIRWAREGRQERITEEDFKTDPDLAEASEQSRAVAQALDQGEDIPGAVEVNLQDEQGDLSAEPIIKSDPTVPPVEEFDLSKHEYLKTPFVNFENLKPMVHKPEVDIPPEVRAELESVKTSTPVPIAELPALQEFIANKLDSGELVLQGNTEPESTEDKKILAVGVDVVDRPGDYLVQETSKPVKITPPTPQEAVDRRAKPKVVVPETYDPRKPVTADTGLTADNDLNDSKEVKAHFGIAFPDRPEKGELYLRVDYLPSRLFKYNGKTWIEVDKTLTDSYVYNEEYIKYLISEIGAGRIDPDDVSPSEREQIAEFLAKDEQSRNAT